MRPSFGLNIADDKEPQSIPTDIFPGLGPAAEFESVYAEVGFGGLHYTAADRIDPKWGHIPGGPGAIVVVRLFYQWPMLVTALGYNFTNLTGNKRLLAATAAFRNEPF